MNPQELFNAMVCNEITRTETLQELEQMTRQFSPAFVTLLIDDFNDILAHWKYEITLEIALAEYNKSMEHYYEQLHAAEYALAMGTNEPIEWPEEPLYMVPPPGTHYPFIKEPSLFTLAMQILAEHQAPKQSEQAGQATPLAPTPTAKQEDAGEPLPPGHPLATSKAVAAFEAVAKLGYMERHGNKWQWLSKACYYGYFVARINYRLKIKGDAHRRPWEEFSKIVDVPPKYVGNPDKFIQRAMQANSYSVVKEGNLKGQIIRTNKPYSTIEECLKRIFGN